MPKRIACNMVRAVETLSVIAAVALAVALLLPRVFGYTPYAVLSGFMEPELPVGSMVYVHETALQRCILAMLSRFTAPTARWSLIRCMRWTPTPVPSAPKASRTKMPMGRLSTMPKPRRFPALSASLRFASPTWATSRRFARRRPGCLRSLPFWRCWPSHRFCWAKADPAVRAGGRADAGTTADNAGRG